MEVLNVEKPENEKTGWMMLLRSLMRCCLSFSRRSIEQLNDGNKTYPVYSEKSRVAPSSDKDYKPSSFAFSSSPMTRGKSSPALSRMGSEIDFSGQLRQFSFSELKHATKNFRPRSVIGEGGFGRVYKGWVNEVGTTPVKPGEGLAVAVKTLNHGGRQGHREWLAEVNYLSKLHHPNLVKLVGFCNEDGQRLLVYEFMARGSLENHLFRRGVQPLPWSVRIKVALDAAKGLAYLHEEIEKPVIYRDFKTSNILLDGDLDAKLSDFGLAKDGPEGDKSHVSTRVMGTFGYTAPEYVKSGHLTAKSDIYSFGIVLLEILSGRKSMDRKRAKGHQNLLDWACPYLRDKRRCLRIMDPSLENNFPAHRARKAVQLVSLCIRHDPKARPPMSEVVRVLTPLAELKDKPHTSPPLLTRLPSNSFKLA